MTRRLLTIALLVVLVAACGSSRPEENEAAAQIPVSVDGQGIAGGPVVGTTSCGVER